MDGRTPSSFFLRRFIPPTCGTECVDSRLARPRSIGGWTIEFPIIIIPAVIRSFSFFFWRPTDMDGSRRGLAGLEMGFWALAGNCGTGTDHPDPNSARSWTLLGWLALCFALPGLLGIVVDLSLNTLRMDCSIGPTDRTTLRKATLLHYPRQAYHPPHLPPPRPPIIIHTIPPAPLRITPILINTTTGCPSLPTRTGSTTKVRTEAVGSSIIPRRM